MIAGLVYSHHQRARAQRNTSLLVSQVTGIFPDAVELGPRKAPHGQREVQGKDGRLLGLVLHTSPEADRFRGYSGPSDVLIAMDPTGRVIGASLLSSEDTLDHVEAVVEDAAFWKSFHGLALGSPGRPDVDVVSGSTLTSDAIAQAVVSRLGGVGESSLFPTGILLVEVRQLLPAAASMEDHPSWSGVQMIYDGSGSLIAHALRTAPSQDSLIGYQGPTDVLVLLDGEAETVLGLRFRKSFDNEDYYERILEDDDYLALYNGRSVEEVAAIDYEEAGIEGVSGATLTSWAVAESVKRRLASFHAERTAPPGPALPFDWRDGLLALLTGGALLMAFTRLRGKPAVRVAWQLVLVVILGFLLGDLLSQALLAGWVSNGVHWRDAGGLLLLAAASFLVPWTTGKQLYCHHLCPHGALQQWIQRLPLPRVKVPARLHRVLGSLPAVLLALVLASIMLGLGINLAALEAFDAYLFRVAGWASITVAVVGLLASAFVPLAYCKYGCPTGLLLKFLRWRGAGDRFDRRDLVAGIFLLGAFALTLT